MLLHALALFSWKPAQVDAVTLISANAIEAQLADGSRQDALPIFKGNKHNTGENIAKKNVPPAKVNEISTSHQNTVNVQVTEGRTPYFFFPGHILDRPPFPISAPNPRQFLVGKQIPPIPFKLRLYIDSEGKVVNIETELPNILDEYTIAPVKEMFYATSFIAGNLHGKDVPSYLDIEVELMDMP